jgi:hypothetical protein
MKRPHPFAEGFKDSQEYKACQGEKFGTLWLGK